MGAWTFTDETSGADISFDDMRATAARGSGVIRDVAARIALDGGKPLWVEGPNRAWLADAIEGSVSVPRSPHPFGKEYSDAYLAAGLAIPTWEGLAGFLRERDDTPAVVTYSICDDFPSATFAPDGWRPDLYDDDRYDAFDDLPAPDRWAISMPFLRAARPDAELAPDLAFATEVAAAEEARVARDRAYLDAIHPTLCPRERDLLAALPPTSHPMVVVSTSIPMAIKGSFERASELGFGSRSRQEIKPEAADWRDMVRWTQRSMFGPSTRVHAFECTDANFEATVRMLVEHDPACIVGISGVARLSAARNFCPALADRPIMTSFAWIGIDRRGPAARPLPADEALSTIRPMSDDELLAYAGDAGLELYREFLADVRARIEKERTT